MKAPTLLLFSLAILTRCLAAEPSRTNLNLLPELRSPLPHPRLFLTQATEDAFKSTLKTDPTEKASGEVILKCADHMLTEAPVVHRLDGRRLLGRSREALGRTTHLSFAYKITGDKKYLERAVTEMKAMAGMPDWNPSHFLDVAEMTLAMSVAYDWLYQDLQPEVRLLARKAIEEKGLGPYLKSGSRHGWEKGGNNWTQVCHAGMLAGALATMEEDAGRTAEVVQRAINGLPFGMKVYQPDGNYPEGPGYWDYGTTFNVLAISMLESSLGTDFGLSQLSGFMKAGDFPLYTMGPTLKPFSFADTGTGTSYLPAMMWFSAKNNAPELLWFQQSLMERSFGSILKSGGASVVDRTFPCLLASSRMVPGRRTPSKTAWYARGQNPLATFRSSWTDTNAWFLGIKAGTPASNHGHMDIGSFVMDALGQRWSMDLGGENYNKLEQRKIDLWNRKQGSDRWKIFRYHNRAHSTLMVNDAEQVVEAVAPIVQFHTDTASQGATVDMTAVYGNELAKALRRFTFDPKGKIIIEDNVTAKGKPAKIRWGMTTQAALQADKNAPASGILTLGGKQLHMKASGAPDMKLTTWPADPPPHDYDTPNPGVRLVGFETTVPAGTDATIRVEFSAP